MIFTKPAAATLPAIFAWAARHTEEVNRFHSPITRFPVFANDAAAAAGNLKVGSPYVDTNGFVRRRMV